MQEPLFLRALRREPVERPPVWLMRQAGRYMSEYRHTRANISFLELCRTPELCAEVMATAVERLGVDAAIIFADLLPLLIPMGFELDYVLGDGPKIYNPFREPSDLARTRELEDLSEMSCVFETVRLTRAAVAPLPVIGFAGAPFTLAGYLVEGGGSRLFLHAKRLMYTHPEAWQELLGRLARTVARYLRGQIEAGAQAVQVFDSWVGVLSPEDFRRYVLPSLQELRANLPSDVPMIYFGAGNPALFPAFAELNADCYGVDWRAPLAYADSVLGPHRALQGNLDPAVLLGSRETIRRETLRILDAFGSRPGFVFNLGHGVHKETPVENAQYLVELVKTWRADDAKLRAEKQ
ncbi:MAG: uroporphyrinogen decarboxylase [Planctomycetia bacterium]|nr:uroporphyrinogen decarboxylase [Planctomycetia bacterium]